MNFENDHIEKEITRVKNEILYRNIKDYPDVLVDLLIEFLSTTTSYIKIDLNKRSIECNIWINDSYQITIVSSYVFFYEAKSLWTNHDFGIYWSFRKNFKNI